MDDGRSPHASPLDDFVRQFWRDQETETHRELEEYLEMFPGDSTAIAREFIELADQAAPISADTDRIGPFKILSELGRGGQGVVYLAEDTRLPRQVAIKMLNEIGPKSTDAMRRFRREAEVASRLDHPSICGIIETGTVRGTPYIVMPFVEGKPLDARFSINRSDDASFTIDFEDESEEADPVAPRAGSTLSAVMIDDLLKTFEKIAEALHAAHEAGVVHRDMKPGNVLVRPDGMPVILDLGLASIDSDDLPALTMSGDVLGTPAYMSPEQVDGPASLLDRRTDVWSLGVTLYECLTGRRPFVGATRHALLDAIRWREPIPAEELNRAATRDLGRVLGVALAKKPEHRYATCADLAEDLRRVREREAILAVPPSPLWRLLRWTQRRKALAASIMLAVIFLISGLVVSLVFLRQSRTNLAGFERLVDVRRLADLESDREALWPAHPRNIAGMKMWIEEAERLRGRLHLHDEELARLRQRPRRREDEIAADELLKELRLLDLAVDIEGLRYLTDSSAGGGELSAETAERHHEAANRIASLEAEWREIHDSSALRLHWFLKDDADQWRHDQTVKFREDARRFFGFDGGSNPLAEMRSRLEQARMLEERMAGLDGSWALAIESIRNSPRYGGLELKPQMALEPLGEDPASGMWEFGVIGSGEMPTRPSTGASVPASQSAIILVLIPGGVFTMGRSDAERPIDGPPHEVELRPYFLAKYEMTQAQWLKLTGENPSALSGGTADDVTLAHPVEQVSWSEAMAGLKRLGLTLPTEAQWEHAARAGSTTEFHSGSDAASLAGFANIADEGNEEGLPRGFDFETGFSDGHARHAPVGSYRPNAWGLHDCAGNVAEWCRDTEEAYDLPVDENGLRLPFARARRVLRGGSWAEIGLYAASGLRNATVPASRSAVLGLRAARELSR